MMGLNDNPLYLAIAAFLLAVVVIGVFGVRMTHVARKLAAETGMGEALMGAVFIGASTSLSGIIASVTAASHGFAEMAVSNALGGIAAQTAFLAIADMFYRKANLEHAAASAENLMMTAFVIALLSIPLVAMTMPDVSIWSVHPASFVMIIAYVMGVRLLAKTHKMPMWIPRHTTDTRVEQEPPKKRWRTPESKKALWLEFVFCSMMVAAAGWVMSINGMSIIEATDLSAGLVGGVFTAVSTSLPELVIAVTAVRLKSLTLAVGDIIGGNAFDTLFLAMSDIAYREGSIYSSISATEQFWLAITIAMSAIIMMGLLHRERHGIANIGWESFAVFILYIFSLFYIAT